MPDGRPLATFLRADEPVKKSKRPKPQRGSSSDWVRDWVSAPGCSPPSAWELQALERVGQRRVRRWLNGRLLLALAGRMTTEDMEGLFKPVPFGDPSHPSAWELLALPENAKLLEAIRSGDPEAEIQLLQEP